MNLGDEILEQRTKVVSLVSVSPLDRLLNQRDATDRIRVAVSCRNKRGGIVKMDSDDFEIKSSQINQEICKYGEQPADN